MNNPVNQMTVKQLVWIVGAMIAGLGGIASLHAAIVVPSIMDKTSLQTHEQLTKAINAHTERPHKGAVNEDQWKLVLKEIDRLATKDQFDSVKERLVRIENRLEKGG